MNRYFLMKRRGLLAALNLWYLPPGMAATDVLAAYRFKGVGSEAVALEDLSMYHRDLTKGTQPYNGVDHTPVWDSSKGFTFASVQGGLCGYLDNSVLDSQAIKAAVVCYADLVQTAHRGYLITAGGADGSAQIYADTTVYVIGAGVKDYLGPGYVSSHYNPPPSSWVGSVACTSTPKTAGVIGANFADDKALFLDGIRTATQTQYPGEMYTDLGPDGARQGHTFGNSHSPKSDLNNAKFAGKTIIAASFYGIALTDADHKYIADAMPFL